jgi:hypothetical protein
VFVPSQVAAASVLLSSSSNLQAVLCQFFREDLISWTSRKGKGVGGGSLQLPNETLKGLVVKNTQQVGAGGGALGCDGCVFCGGFDGVVFWRLCVWGGGRQ